MALNGVIAVVLRYFSEFAYLPGVLSESSRSLSHFLMSSCTINRYHIFTICTTTTTTKCFSERELAFTFAICCRPSVCLSVCNVRAPYSGGSNFRQYFYGIRYLGHPLTSTENFTEIVPGEPIRRGRVAKYSDFGPVDGYISETVQDRR